jgi:transposase-like protein
MAVTDSGETLVCPRCGTTNPAVMNRSDGTQCYRCDKCAFQWGASPASEQDTDMPPVPAIDAQGG